MSDQTHQRPPPLRLSTRAQNVREQPISYLMSAALADPTLISFAAGFVDPLTLPVEPVGGLLHTMLNDPVKARAALQYDTTLGLRSLRQSLHAHLAGLDGVPAGQLPFTADQILITTGSQQALYLAAEASVEPGDIVLLESPSYFVYTAALESFGVRLVGVPMDAHGLRVDLLERQLRDFESTGQLARVRAVYTVPDHQNPTGLSLSVERRAKLLEIVRRFSCRSSILIFEDAAYRELTFDQTDQLRSIKQLDTTNEWVVYFGTFSKPFAPGIKTGYAVMPPELLSVCLTQKGHHDFGSPSLCQHLADAALRSGVYASNLHKLRAGYRRKCETLLEALRRHMPEGVRWTKPAGGLYVWLTLPDSIDTSRGAGLFEAALREGVLYVPGAYCHVPKDDGSRPVHELRLCFAVVENQKIEPGVERLARAIAGQLSRAASQPRGVTLACRS